MVVVGGDSDGHAVVVVAMVDVEQPRAIGVAVV